MTEMRSRPIAGQLQYDLGPVATPLGPAVSTTPKVGPTDDGKRVLSFGGTQYLAGAATLAAQFVGLAPFTAVWLASRSVGGAAAHWALDDVGATDNRIAQFLSGGDLQSSHRTAAGAQTSASGSVTVLNEVYVHSIVFDGAQVATWLDGVASIPPTANTRAPATLDELVLGAQRSGAALVAFMRGLGGVLWICSGALSTPSRQAVESAMGAYYGYPL